MKNYFVLTGICLLFSLSAKAQFSSIFGQNNTTWHVKTDQLFGEVNDSLTFHIDTIVNLKPYKVFKLYREGTTETRIFVEEEVVAGKAWYQIPGDTTRFLIMDLSLNLGDTFLFDGFPIVSDSVFTLNGLRHIRFNHYIDNSASIKFTMIEGVGTNAGIAYHGSAALSNLNPLLLCQQKNDTLFWVNNVPNYAGNCEVITSVIELTEQIQLKLYPVPSSNRILVDFPGIVINPEYKIIDSAGKLVSRGKLHREIDIEFLSPGLYYLIIVNKERRLTAPFNKM